MFRTCLHDKVMRAPIQFEWPRLFPLLRLNKSHRPRFTLPRPAFLRRSRYAFNSFVLYGSFGYLSVDNRSSTGLQEPLFPNAATKFFGTRLAKLVQKLRCHFQIVLELCGFVSGARIVEEEIPREVDRLESFWIRHFVRGRGNHVKRLEDGDGEVEGAIASFFHEFEPVAQVGFDFEQSVEICSEAWGGMQPHEVLVGVAVAKPPSLLEQGVRFELRWMPDEIRHTQTLEGESTRQAVATDRNHYLAFGMQVVVEVFTPLFSCFFVGFFG